MGNQKYEVKTLKRRYRRKTPSNTLRSLGVVGLSEKIIPISNSTGVGMENLHSALSRIINMGEEIED